MLLISAVTCPAETGKHGVKIGDYCADCGLNDSICPEDFGDDVCKGQYDPDCPVTEEIYWKKDRVLENEELVTIDLLSGGTLDMVVIGTGLPVGESITFRIYEDDGIFGKDEYYSVEALVQEGYDQRAVATLNFDETSDVTTAIELAETEETNKPAEFIFTVEQTSTGTWSGATDTVLEKIYFNLTRQEDESTDGCSRYLDNDSCVEDEEEVARGTVTGPHDPDDGCEYQYEETCEWDEISDTCATETSPEEVMNEGTEECPNGTATPRLFACRYDIEESTECEAGDEFYKIFYKSSKDPTTCQPYETQPIPCPASLKLPFFGFYGILSSLLMIGLIYFFYRREFD